MLPEPSFTAQSLPWKVAYPPRMPAELFCVVVLIVAMPAPLLTVEKSMELPTVRVISPTFSVTC